jgi:hypothetical protein
MYKKAYLILALFNYMAHPSIELSINPRFYTQKGIDLNMTTHLGDGFFYELNKVLQSIIYFEDQGLCKVEVNWTDQFFPYKNSPTENGWTLYFETIKTDYVPHENETITRETGGGFHEIHDQSCSCHWIAYEQYFPYRNYVHQKLNKYIQIKRNIIDELNEFYEAHMKNYFMIGVHIRFATIHAQEVPGRTNPRINDYIEEINKLMEIHKHKNIKIFLASDSHYIINEFRKLYGNKLLYIEAHRATYDEDPHLIYQNTAYWISNPAEFHLKKPGYLGGKTALLDCLILSKCNVFVHTTSNVAAAVVFFNPHIDSVYLPKIEFTPCRFIGNPDIKNPLINPI